MVVILAGAAHIEAPACPSELVRVEEPRCEFTLLFSAVRGLDSDGFTVFAGERIEVVKDTSLSQGRNYRRLT